MLSLAFTKILIEIPGQMSYNGLENRFGGLREERMLYFVKKCFENRILRYVFFGGCTTLVNLCSYYILRELTALSVTVCNVSSISLAILFAYVVNARFVFDSDSAGGRDRAAEFLKFVGARLSTMAIEVAGVWIMVRGIGIGDYYAKFIIQFIVLVLNYVFSRFFVFVKKR